MGRHHLAVFCLTFAAISFLSPAASAQKRVSADVEVKSLFEGKVVTTRKSVYCSSNGRLVVYSTSPVNFVQTTNPNGESSLYFPDRNEVSLDNSGDVSSRNELLFLMLSGHLSDLGLTYNGYALASSGVDADGYVVRTYTATIPDFPPKVEVVLKDFLPVYAAYYSPDGKVAMKTYFSNYQPVGRMRFPCRQTGIMYSKGDSVVVRTLYSNIAVDRDDPGFDFVVPADAKPVDPDATLQKAIGR